MDNNRPDIITKKRIGLFLSTLISLYVGMVAIWPVSHFWFLFLVVIGVFSLLLLDGEHTNKTIIAITAMVALVCAPIYFYSPQEYDFNGTLVPADGTRPSNSCDSDRDIQLHAPENSIMIIAGTNAAWVSGNGKTNILQIKDKTILSMERENNLIRFDADIYNNDGQLAAYIRKNKFYLVKDGYAEKEHSTKDKLLIFNDSGEALLDVNFINKNTIIIKGVFETPDGITIKITDSGIDHRSNKIHFTYAGECSGQVLGGGTIFKFTDSGFVYR